MFPEILFSRVMATVATERKNGNGIMERLHGTAKRQRNGENQALVGWLKRTRQLRLYTELALCLVILASLVTGLYTRPALCINTLG